MINLNAFSIQLKSDKKRAAFRRISPPGSSDR